MYVMNSSFERFASANKHLHKDTKINVKYYQNQNFSVFQNSKQKHFKNQRSAKKMCSFFESCCMRCDVTGKYIHCGDCGNTPTSKASCRKILFEIGPGCIYYQNCIDCCKKLKIEFDRSRHFYSEYFYTNYFLKKYF